MRIRSPLSLIKNCSCLSLQHMVRFVAKRVMQLGGNKFFHDDRGMEWICIGRNFLCELQVIVRIEILFDEFGELFRKREVCKGMVEIRYGNAGVANEPEGRNM